MKSKTLSYLFMLLLAFIFCGISKAQKINPVNSNYLINQGVSPRVLDFAANSALQDGSLKEGVKLRVRVDGQEESYEFHSIYDPSYEYGLDLRFVVDGSKTSKKDARQLSDAIKNLHHFSRLVEQYLYDESTLKLVKNENKEVVYEYFYRKVDIDPSMVFIKRLKGNIYFKEGVLDYVELTNTRPMKKGVDNYNKKVYFKQAADIGGHFCIPCGGVI